MNKNEARNIILVAAASLFYYLLSFLGHWNYVINAIVFAVISLVVLFLAIKKFELAVALALLELVLSSFGRMFFLDIYDATISLRMVLFFIIIGVWIIKKGTGFRVQGLGSSWHYLPFFLTIVWGVVRGIIRGNNFDNILSDANAFLFFGYLGPAIEVWRKAGWGRVRQILAGGIIAVWVITMFSAIGFSYDLFEIGDGFYKWIRDSRLGEITFVNDQFSRVFFQSHLYALLGIFLFSSRQYLMFGVLSASIIWVDLSRSFWAGAILGVIILMGFLFKNKKSLQHSREWFLVPILVLIAGFVLGTLILPDLPQVVFGRSSSINDPAASSRRLLLPVVANEIKKNPILGSGFGTTLTYKTTDPRALKVNPSGEVTTYAFEWGALDLWVKTGLIGILAYIGLILAILRRLYRRFRLTNDSIYLGAVAGLLALSATHIFSPYLNHPLGIGAILFIDNLSQGYLDIRE